MAGQVQAAWNQVGKARVGSPGQPIAEQEARAEPGSKGRGPSICTNMLCVVVGESSLCGLAGPAA